MPWAGVSRFSVEFRGKMYLNFLWYEILLIFFLTYVGAQRNTIANSHFTFKELLLAEKCDFY